MSVDLKPNLKCLLIEKRNSVDFVEQVLSAYAADLVVVPVSGQAPAVLQQFVSDETVQPDVAGGWFGKQMKPRADDAPAHISLTSGTTGAPKPILLSHRSLGDVTHRLADIMRIDNSIREYVGVPVTFSFGLGRIRVVAAHGGAAFIPENGFRVDEFAVMLRRGEVNALSAVPTLLRMVLNQRERFADTADNLRWIEIGSQPMSASEKEALRKLFPSARIVQHYGLTEASRSTFLEVSNVPSKELESVGQPTGSVGVKITDEGRIAISGSHLADGIITPAGLVPIAGSDGWLVTQDLGHLSGDNLVFDGRADDLINVGGLKVPAELFEAKLRERLGGAQSFGVAAGEDPLRGQLVVIAHEPTETPEDIARIDTAARDTARELGIGGAYALHAVPTIPRTDTGKVRRFLISQGFDCREPNAEASPEAPETGSEDGRVEAAFVAMFGEKRVEEGASFHSLGGDSLNYVQMLTALERVIPDLPEDWASLSIAALSRLAKDDGGTQPRRSLRQFIPANLDTVRGLACTLVVALHIVGTQPTEGLKLPMSSPWRDTMDVLELIRMPLFTAMAGFLYAAMPSARAGFWPFMRRKLAQLLIPLLFATLVYWGLRQVTYGRHDSLLAAYIIGYQHLWYLDAILLMFAFVSFSDLKLGEQPRTWAAVLALAIFAAAVMPTIHLLHIDLTLRLLPQFVLGMLLYRAPALLRSNPLLAVSTIAIVVILTLRLVDPRLFHVEILGLALALMCGGASVIFFLRVFPSMQLFERIAPYSFTIYLWHPAANAAVRNGLWKFGLHSTPVLFCTGLASGILIPIALHRFMIRLPRVLSAPVIAR